jgi:hypothetical protein
MLRVNLIEGGKEVSWSVTALCTGHLSGKNGKLVMASLVSVGFSWTILHGDHVGFLCSHSWL